MKMREERRMGKKYRIITLDYDKNEIELEELDDNRVYFSTEDGLKKMASMDCTAILKHKEYGMVSIDEVLRIFDKCCEDMLKTTTFSFNKLRKAIENMGEKK
jgi:hypothetical protein